VRRLRLAEESGIFAVLIVVALVLSILSPNFRTFDNLSVLLVNGTVIAFLALGQTFVLLTGGIDLSTGSNVAMTGVLAALVMQAGAPWPIACVIALVAGTALGVLNGVLVHFLRIPAFIATFSTQGVALAIPLIITGAKSIAVLQPGFSWIGQGKVAGLPLPVLLLIVVAVIAALFLRMTRPGVHIYALGGNKAAARLAGVNIPATTILVYAVSGFCAGMGGLIATSRLMVGFPATGTGNELFYSIAAAVVGGVSLFGGVGSVLGAMIGAVLIATVSNGMNVLNVQSYWQSLVIGVIILVGVSFDTFRRFRGSRGRVPRKPATPSDSPTSPPQPRQPDGGAHLKGMQSMKMRNSGALATAGLLVVAALAGCSNAATSAGGGASSSSGLPANCTSSSPTLGVSLPNTVNPYYIAMRQSFLDNGKAAGYTVNVAIANDSDSTQLSRVQAFIQQKVCAVALNGVNSGPAAASVAALNQANIPVFTVNVIVDPASLKAQNATIIQYVGADQTQGGTEMGDQAIKDIGTSTPLVVGIVGDPDQLPTNQRDKGFTDALKAKNSNVTVLPTVNSKVDPNIALQVTSDLLQSNPNINTIFADTGPGAVGALQAIKQSGKGDKVSLYAFCAADTALTGFYKACAAQEPAQYAKVVVDNIKSYLGGAKVPAEVLEAPKVFLSGQTPGPGEVG